MASVLELSDVSVVRDGNRILDSITWAVDSEERWVVLGPNGAGKTTLLSIASASIHPSSGTARVLDDTLGKVDVFELRPRIGFASTALARRVPAGETVLDVVLTAAYSVTGRWNEQYDDIDTRRARRVLAEWKLDHLEQRRFGSLSDGEQKRVQIARAVMTDPELLLLDEPAASLDLGAREELLQLLGGYASSEFAPGIIMVTHHVEEIPRAFTHALLLKEGRIQASGPLDEVISAERTVRRSRGLVLVGLTLGSTGLTPAHRRARPQTSVSAHLSTFE
jgi:iron complex transport system ATP-binding protein